MGFWEWARKSRVQSITAVLLIAGWISIGGFIGIYGVVKQGVSAMDMLGALSSYFGPTYPVVAWLFEKVRESQP